MLFLLFYTTISVKKSSKISQHESKSGFFQIPIACWSGFGIFKQNRDNPDQIGMVGQSHNGNFPMSNIKPSRLLVSRLG